VPITSGVLLLERRVLRNSLGAQFTLTFFSSPFSVGQSQWPRGLRRKSGSARLLRLWVPVPPAVWTFVCYDCCVFSGRRLCDELITRPEESHQLWCVVVCDLETS
jgi:hypothetical protein